MLNPLKIAAATLGLAVAVQAHAGITDITFTDTGHTAGQEWPIVPGFWYIRAILTDSAHQPIGVLSTETTFNTSSVASLPIGTQVTLDGPAPIGSIVIVYRSTSPINDGDVIESAEYPGLCPAGCVKGALSVPISGQLLNSDFKINQTAMPVTLQSYSVD